MRTSKTTSHTDYRTCPECLGDGYLEYEYASPMSNSTPYGDYYSKFEACWNCKGSGEVEYDEEEDSLD